MDPEPVASADESARTWSGASGVPRAGRAGGDKVRDGVISRPAISPPRPAHVHEASACQMPTMAVRAWTA